MAAPIKLISMATPEVEVENIGDGGVILRSPQPLGEYPDSQNAWLIAWAEETPDAIFVADRTGPNGDWRRVTYKDFLAQVKSIGQALLNRGLSVERPVAILSDNAVDNALLLFGAMHVGIPVAPISPAYSLMSQDFGKLKYIVETVSPGLVYVADGEKFGNALNAIDIGNAEIVVGDNPPKTGKSTAFADLLATEPTADVDQAYKKVGPDTIAKILFTSGSTGQPKGVLNTQRMLCSNQQAMAQCWSFVSEKPPVVVDWLPWNHTFGGNYVLNMTLRNGGTIYVDGGKPAPGIIEQTVANLKEISPTIYNNVPRGFDMLMPYLESDAELRESFFKNLDVIFYAAAALTQTAWERLEALSEQATGQRVMMLSGWGSTETAPDNTIVYWPIEKAGVIGLPIPGTEIKLVPNEDKLEVRVRGPNIMPGYWHQEELTKEVFDEDGFYCIGDAARYEDPLDASKGIVFDGRVSENFKLSTGTWVSVGNLRTDVVAAADNVIQDAVIAGHDNDAIGILIFPNIAGCRALCPDLAEDAPLDEIITQPSVEQALVEGLQSHNVNNPGSSTRITRALIMTEPPNIDANEITDKGYMNQRAVLTRRAELVELLFGENDKNIIIE
ncbi:MAG: feruloyl-CoA synthase [Rhodospirillaceae bacterium]|jgi:feruloyl-CoA synthase|nr:feruloyl-CoA synthase [Rhodospirillaceae bacterium]MBT7955883.1 feruloyl-CoA synthase [Rhodospirillaceae bacterium]